MNRTAFIEGYLAKEAIGPNARVGRLIGKMKGRLGMKQPKNLGLGKPTLDTGKGLSTQTNTDGAPGTQAQPAAGSAQPVSM